MYAYMCVCNCSRGWVGMYVHDLAVCMYVCSRYVYTLYTYTQTKNTCMHIYVCMNVYIHICMNVYMCLHIYVCMHVCIYAVAVEDGSECMHRVRVYIHRTMHVYIRMYE